MRATAIALAAGILAAGPALAEECTIEDWTHSYQAAMQALLVEGATTCKAGQIQLRLYDGEGDSQKLIGVANAFIEGHIFQAMKLQVAKPTALSIKYNIKAE